MLFNLPRVLLWSGVFIATCSAAPTGMYSEGESDLGLRDVNGYDSLSTRSLYDIPYEYEERDLMDHDDGLYERELYDGIEDLYGRDLYDEGNDLYERELVQRNGGEQVKHLSSYAAAAAESSHFVNSGKMKVDPAKLELYVSRLKSSHAHGKVVGVVTPLIRLDMDNTGKGIHFNAVDLSDSSKKLAAVIQRTESMTPGARTELYMQYVSAIQNRGPKFLWHWWTTGKTV
ncbi:hypothetical protein AMATHDRAFT_6990 [Amanita thiersii Skay4041]|uniref:Uncharacterized protein n=1 Tax=Amanita thiersii Skay4041 TaxID=703135 RepID=A0A2A9NAV8_9AGAR|nr:hypothetical protein AMATHDRAFT_6990 [Amanita thiersii Skay4041]